MRASNCAQMAASPCMHHVKGSLIRLSHTHPTNRLRVDICRKYYILGNRSLLIAHREASMTSFSRSTRGLNRTVKGSG
jgi:hypothetical protein